MPHCDIGTIVAGLNPEQAAAVTAPVGAPLLVLAGAGCGKTTVLTRRIAYLAGEFCPANAVLALTFTRAAAREMAERVAAFPKENAGSGQPLITTFHAFCLRLLLWTNNGVPLYTRLGYAKRPRLVSEQNRLRMLAEASTREERLALCADVLDLSIMLARRAVFSPGASRPTPDLEAVVLDIERRYARAKKQAGLWDFSDFIACAVELMDKHPQAAAGFLSRFRAVLVDEFQDTNPAQIRLLEKILVPRCRCLPWATTIRPFTDSRARTAQPFWSSARDFPARAFLNCKPITGARPPFSRPRTGFSEASRKRSERCLLPDATARETHCRGARW